jgi:hypothetical protein
MKKKNKPKKPHAEEVLAWKLKKNQELTKNFAGPVFKTP